MGREGNLTSCDVVNHFEGSASEEETLDFRGLPAPSEVPLVAQEVLPSSEVQ
jgi:hypothetical protein